MCFGKKYFGLHFLQFKSINSAHFYDFFISLFFIFLKQEDVELKALRLEN